MNAPPQSSLQGNLQEECRTCAGPARKRRGSKMVVQTASQVRLLTLCSEGGAPPFTPTRTCTRTPDRVETPREGDPCSSALPLESRASVSRGGEGGGDGGEGGGVGGESGGDDGGRKPLLLAGGSTSGQHPGVSQAHHWRVHMLHHRLPWVAAPVQRHRHLHSRGCARLACVHSGVDGTVAVGVVLAQSVRGSARLDAAALVEPR